MTLSPSKIVSLDLTDLEAITSLCARYPELHWNAAKLKATLELPHVLAFGLYQDERLISIALFAVVLEEAELLLLVTHPDFRGQAYAEQLFLYAKDQLLPRALEKIFLEVRASNLAAIKIYHRLGFQQIHVRKNYYQAPPEDALIMALKLLPAAT